MFMTHETNAWLLSLIKQFEEVKAKEIKHLDEVGMRESTKEMLDPNYEEKYENLESKLFDLDTTIEFIKDLCEFEITTPEEKMNEKHLAAQEAITNCKLALQEYAEVIKLVEEDVVNANSYVTQIKETLEILSDLKTTLTFD